MNNPLISTIITTYKREYKFLIRSINSVIRQSYKNIEIIVVDDNNSNSIYRDELEKRLLVDFSHIRYIKHSINLGAQVSRNDGIKAANGEYVAFLDDDDEWLPEKIEKQVAAINNDDDIGLVYCKGYSKIEGKEDVEMKEYCTASNFKEEVTFSDLLYADYIGTTTQALVSKKILEKFGGFDTNQLARQDYEVWLNISQYSRCIGVNEYLFIHYVHEGEQISKSNEKAISGLMNIYLKYKKNYDNNSLAACHILIILGRLYVKNGKRSLGFSYFLKAIEKIPKIILLDYKNLKKVVIEHRGAKRSG